jgi:Zn-finger protein
MNYKYFIHKDCTFYPCHNLQEWASCLFCWCPLYLCDCEGDYVFKNGLKDCLGCCLPHTEEGYYYVLEKVKKEIYGLRVT